MTWPSLRAPGLVLLRAWCGFASGAAAVSLLLPDDAEPARAVAVLPRSLRDGTFRLIDCGERHRRRVPPPSVLRSCPMVTCTCSGGKISGRSVTGSKCCGIRAAIIRAGGGWEGTWANTDNSPRLLPSAPRQFYERNRSRDSAWGNRICSPK